MIGTRPLAIPASVARDGLLVAASLVAAAALGASVAAGHSFIAGLAVAGTVAGVVALERPRWALLALLLATGTLLPSRFWGFEVAGIRSDIPEALLLLVIAGWMVSTILQPRSRAPFAFAVSGLVAAAASGAITALVRGAEFGEVLGPLKTYLFWLLVLPLGEAIRRAEGGDWLERSVLVIGVAASALALGLALMGLGVPSGETAGVTSLGVESDVVRYRPAVLQIAFVATFLLAHRAAVAGWTAKRAGALGVLLLVQAISFNRSTWVALVVCLGLYGVLRVGQGKPLQGLSTALSCVAVVVGALLLASAGVLGNSAEALALRARSIVTPSVFEERSQQLRNEENEIAWSAIKRRPITGVGLNQRFGARTSAFSHQAGVTVYSDTTLVHNTYLKLWLETGLAGILAVAALMFGVARTVRRHRRSAGALIASRSLAMAMCLLGFALQAIYQTKLYHRPTIVAAAVALAILGSGDAHVRQRHHPPDYS